MLLRWIDAEVIEFVMSGGVGLVFGRPFCRTAFVGWRAHSLDQFPIVLPKGIDRAGSLQDHVIPHRRPRRRLGECSEHTEAVFGSVLWQRHPENLGERGDHVGQPDHLIAHGAGRHPLWPADEERLAEAAFVFGVLAAAERPVDGEPGVEGTDDVLILPVDDAAVITRKHDQRVVGERKPIERGEQLANAPVELLNEVPVAAVVAAGKTRTGGDRPVHGIRCKVDEERLRTMRLDPAGRLGRQRLHDLVRFQLMGNARCSSRRDGDSLSRNTVDDPVVFDERMGPVVGIGSESKEGVEADRQRSRRQGPAPVRGWAIRLEAKMPFPECRRLIALALAERCERQPIRLDVEWGIDGQHLTVLDVRAPVVAAGHQAVAGRRTDRPRGVGIGKSAALAGEAIEIRGFEPLGAVAGGTSPAKIIRQDDHDVWLRRFRFVRARGRRRTNADARDENCHEQSEVHDSEPAKKWRKRVATR